MRGEGVEAKSKSSCNAQSHPITFDLLIDLSWQSNKREGERERERERERESRTLEKQADFASTKQYVMQSMITSTIFFFIFLNYISVQST